MIRRFSVNFAIFSMFMDVVIIVFVLWLTTYFRAQEFANIPFIKEIRRPVSLPLILYAVFPVVWVALMQVFSVYDGRKNLRIVDELTSLTFSALLAGISLAGILYFSYRDISRFLFILFISYTYLMLLVWRVPARQLYQWRNRKLGRIRSVLIVGAGIVGREVEAQMRKFPRGIFVVGFLDDDDAKWSSCADILGSLVDARDLVQRQRIDDVVIALPLRAYSRMNRLLGDLFDLPVRVQIVPDYFQWTLHHADVEDFAGIPLLDVRAPALTENQRVVKRIFDILVTSLIMIPALPLMGLIALAIWLDDGSPIFFNQQRAGENGRVFVVHKFRTMIKDAENLRHLVEKMDDKGKLIHKRPDDPRITRVGRILRKFSLDELPQFFNILRGSMSLVGPRPELPYLVEKYEPWQRKRFAVPQGLTGWWQIHGRSDKPMHLHTEEDLYYIQNYSIWLDIQILIKTFWIVLRGKGAY
jgi:exopolysaccharide biosynthesis polyprenyl glycosylphosphotransferase